MYGDVTINYPLFSFEGSTSRLTFWQLYWKFISLVRALSLCLCVFFLIGCLTILLGVSFFLNSLIGLIHSPSVCNLLLARAFQSLYFRLVAGLHLIEPRFFPSLLPELTIRVNVSSVSSMVCVAPTGGESIWEDSLCLVYWCLQISCYSPWFWIHISLFTRVTVSHLLIVVIIFLVAQLNISSSGVHSILCQVIWRIQVVVPCFLASLVFVASYIVSLSHGHFPRRMLKLAGQLKIIWLLRWRRPII